MSDTSPVPPRDRLPSSPGVKSVGPTWVHDWLTHLSVALALGLTVAVLIFVPLRSISFQSAYTMAVPTGFDHRVTDFYRITGVKVESHSEWALLKLLRAGPAYVITSEVMANSASVAEPKGEFTKLYPESIVLASRSPSVQSFTDFSQLGDSFATVYLDQGVSRLELMSALGLQHQADGTQDFSAPQAKGLLQAINHNHRLHTGSSIKELAQALQLGHYCLTTDRRAAQAGAKGSPTYYAPAPTLSTWIGIWERNPHNSTGASSLANVPEEFFTPTDYPSLDPSFRETIHAEPVTNLNRFNEFVWDASLYNDTFNGSWEWENTNEGYQLVGFIVLLCLLSFWAGWRFWTASSTYVRTAVLIQAVILILWILARIVKHASLGVFERYAWYYYYVPIYTTMAILFFVLAHSQHGRPPGFRYLRFLIITVGAVLILLVFTNDLHHWVLRFGSGKSGVDYSYGPGYYLHYGAVLLVFIAVMYAGLWSLRGNRMRLVAGIGLLFVLLVSYSVAYTVRIPLVRSTETVQMYCVVFVLTWEILFFIGAIGQNRGYLHFFEKSQIPVEIVDQDWLTRYHTRQPLGLNQDTRQQLRDGQKSVLVTGPLLDSNRTVYCQSRPIDAGHVLWETDVSAVTDLEKALAALRAREAHQTEILRAEYMATLNMEESADAPVLFDRLDELMNGSLMRIQANATRLDAHLGESERSQVLRNIKMDLGYAKRASLLTLQHFERNSVSVNALTTFLSQSCTDFSYTGSLAGLHGPTSGVIQLEVALRCLEGLHRGLNQMIRVDQAAVFVNFEVSSEGSTAQLNWIIDCPSADFQLLEPLLYWEGAQSELFVEDSVGHLNMTVSDAGCESCRPLSRKEVTQ